MWYMPIGHTLYTCVGIRVLIITFHCDWVSVNIKERDDCLLFAALHFIKNAFPITSPPFTDLAPLTVAQWLSLTHSTNVTMWLVSSRFIKKALSIFLPLALPGPSPLPLAFFPSPLPLALLPLPSYPPPHPSLFSPLPLPSPRPFLLAPPSFDPLPNAIRSLVASRLIQNATQEMTTMRLQGT